MKIYEKTDWFRSFWANIEIINITVLTVSIGVLFAHFIQFDVYVVLAVLSSYRLPVCFLLYSLSFLTKKNIHMIAAVTQSLTKRCSL